MQRLPGKALYIGIGLAFFLCGYTTVQAQELAAGFQPAALWVSKTSLTAGDSATFYTVVYDSSDTAITGDAIFMLDSMIIGSKHFSLGAGTTQILSLPWAATVGAHTVSATIENTASDTPLALTTSNTLSLMVAAPPPPSPLVAAAGSVINTVLQGVPLVVGTVQSARDSAIHAIQNQLATNDTGNSVDGAPKGQVLGVSDYRAPQATSSALAASAATSGSYFGKLWNGFLRILLSILQSNVLFWLALILVIYILFRIILLIFRERKHKTSP